VQKEVCDHGEFTGWTVYPWKSVNNRGVTDRIFLKKKIILFVEFKSPGEEATKQQALVHGTLRSQGFEVHVIDNVSDGVRLLNGYPM